MDGWGVETSPPPLLLLLLILLHSLFVVEVQGLDTLEGGFEVLYVCGGGVGVPARRYALVL